MTAWKEGKSAESLKNDNPPIVVSDHACATAHRLVKYEIKPGDRVPARTRVSKSILWLQDDKVKAKGKAESDRRRPRTTWAPTRFSPSSVRSDPSWRPDAGRRLKTTIIRQPAGDSS